MVRTTTLRRVQMMALAIALACSGALPAGQAQERAATLTPPGAFQIDVVPVSTSLGTPTLSRTIVEEVVAAVGESYRSLTGGAITVSLRRIRDPHVATREPVRAFDIAAVRSTTPDPGFRGVATVAVVPRDERSANVAEAYGSTILLAAPWDESTKYLLAHEFAHTIGLEHADAAECTKSVVTTCTVYGYGDRSDTMGLYRPYFFERPAPLIRFSAVNLRQLGVLPDAAVITLSTTRELTLSPVYSDAGIRMAIIPAYGAPAYALEYRPAQGDDEVLAWTRINEAPSRLHGVQVRLLTSNSDPNLTLLPYVVGRTEGAVLTQNGRQGLLAGERMQLADSSVIEVLATDERGARIRVTVPKDTAPPVVRSDAIQWEQNPSSATLMVKENEFSRLRMLIDPRTVKDDRGVASVVLEVNGEAVARKENPGLFAELTYQPQRTGMFSVRVKVRDYAGNQTTVERTLTSLPYRVQSTAVRLIPRAGAMDVVFRDPGPGWSHTISQLSAGRVMAPATRSDAKWKVITITGVRPGVDVSFTFTTRDPFGRSDGGREFRFRLRR